MSNVTVQEALNKAIELMDAASFEVNKHFAKNLDDAVELCKAALFEIEKCEPVAYDKNKIRSEVMSKSPIPFGVCDAIDLTMQAMEHLITSPQPRDWVGLSDDELKETFNSADYKAMVTIDDVFFIAARAIEAKLKQLNTKG